MLSQSQVASPAFSRATGRSQPALTHPTAKAFQAQPWEAILSDPNTGGRDYNLALGALYLSKQISSLRESVIANCLQGLDKTQVIELGCAQSNRACLLISDRVRKSVAKGGRSNEMEHLRDMMKVGGHRLQPELSADEVITSVVDTFPHWLSEANAVDKTGRLSSLREAGATAEGALSVERSLRNIWQGMLWEGNALSLSDSGEIQIQPDPESDAIIWAAWEFRQEALYMQSQMLEAAAFRANTVKRSQPTILLKSPTSIRRNGRAVRFILGPPSQASRRKQNFWIDTLTSSYLEPFLDEPVTTGSGQISARMLNLATAVLSDMVTLLAKEVGRPEILKAADLQRLSFGISRTSVLVAIRDSLGVDEETAKQIISLMTTSSEGVAHAFRHGMWHRPIIDVAEMDKVFLLGAAILYGSPIRRTEKWLSESGKADVLGKSTRGIAYENSARNRLFEAMQSNPKITDFSFIHRSLSQKEFGEEVDVIFRLGNTVIVGEVKCLVVPSESSERFDHISKVESACAQASRKAAHVKVHLDKIADTLDLEEARISEYRVLPIVILNNGVGTSLRFQETVVMDLSFLELYLGSPEYVSSSVIGPRGEFIPTHQKLYNNQQEAEMRIEETLERHPGLKKFQDAVRKRLDKFSVMNGLIEVAAFELDEASMVSPKEKAVARTLLREAPKYSHQGAGRGT